MTTNVGRVLSVFIVCALMAFLVHTGWHFWEPLQNWLAVHTGTVNEAGPYYGFFSGFGSDLGEVTLVAGLLAIFHKHNCHVQGCWRIGKHNIDGTPWCNKHHLHARLKLANTGSAHGIETVTEDKPDIVVDNTTIDTDFDDGDNGSPEAKSPFGFCSGR